MSIGNVSLFPSKIRVRLLSSRGENLDLPSFIEKKNYVGRATLPTSIQEKETHWLRRAVNLLHHKRKGGKG
eukprot:1139310-Pelagomonas_calceolata.AAC.1